MYEMDLGKVYSKVLRQGKLGIFTELYLRFRGKRDYLLGVVCKTGEGVYSSPFIEQEKNFLEMAIRKEQERLERGMIKNRIGIEIAEVQIEEMSQKGTIFERCSDVNREEILIKQSKTSLSIRQKELRAYVRLENNIMDLRCEELYHIVLARIDAYWSGVLQASTAENATETEEIGMDFKFEQFENSLRGKYFNNNMRGELNDERKE